MKTIMLITEKRSISESLVKALAPETYDNFGCTSALHNDIVTVRKLPKGLMIDNSGNNYFNTVNPINYEIIPEHLDHMGHKSARRIKRKMKYINEHITSDLEKPILEIITKKKSIDDICSTIEEKDYPQKDILDLQTESLQDVVAMTLRSLEDQRKIRSDKGLYFPTEEGRRFLREESRKILIPEDINYFLFERDGYLVIVLDTYGNPLNYQKADKDYLQKIIIDSENYKDLEKKMKLSQNFQASNPHDLKSHVVRMSLFHHILGKRRLPCEYKDMKAGSLIQLEKVIAATDFDIAGSAIFLSVIEYSNELSKKHNKKTISSDMLYRLVMHTMDPEEIKKSFNDPKSFDWENAYAGKARSVFDFLYGTSISSQLQHFNRDPSLNISTGRTLFLGLKKIIEEERKLKNEAEKDYIYVAFNGLLDLDQIKNAIVNKDYVLMHLKQKKNYISHPTFINLCKADEIGTHTTRYKNAKRLEKLGVISIIDNKLFSTPYGNVHYGILASYLDSSSLFNITTWNRNIQATINSWRTDTNKNKPRTMEEMEEEFHKFMRIFLPLLKGQLKDLTDQRYLRITRELSEAYQKSKNFEFLTDNLKKKYESPKDAFLLVGTESNLTLDDINKLVDSKSNKVKEDAISKIIRMIPQEPLSLVDYIRRTFNINRDYDFNVISSYNSKALVGMNNENYTVFRTEISKGTSLKDFLNEGLKIDEYVACELDESNFEKEGESSAHEALMVRDIKRSDIAGADGLRLTEEYHKPWYHTHDKLKKQANGQINVESFKSGDHSFQRIERYKFGVVHNFESLLVAMLEKYNMPFWKTAKLAEEMYLNEGK